jgi:hypothetical protein
MRKLLVFLLVLSIAFPCFAGAAWYEDTRPQKLRPVKAPEVVSEKPAPEVVRYVETKTIEKLVEKPKENPARNFYIGYLGNYSALGWNNDWINLQVGYNSLAGNQSALLKVDGLLWQSKDAWTKLNIGGLVLLDANSMFGFVINAEQYLTPSLSIGASLIPIMSGSASTNLGTAFLEGRWYF